MDAHVQVALIEKAKRVFALAEDLFLSFPLQYPLSFRAEELSAILAPQSPADYAQAANFAMSMNFVPRDAVATPSPDSMLWDVFDDVLSRALVAAGQKSPELEARYDAAQTLLYATDGDGIRHESQAYMDYRRYRDALYSAQEDYGMQKETALLAGDEQAKKRWTELVEPQLRSAVDQALINWTNLGHKEAVEAAIADLMAAAASNPRARWADWRAGFNRDTDLLHAGAQGFAPTAYSPTDIATAASWLHTGLEAAEIDALVAGAPPELHSDGTSDIQRIEFDYRSVSVTRAWFNPAPLTSRIWRLQEGDEPLSLGAEAAGGRLPAYVTAMVLVRNVCVTRKSNPAQATAIPLQFTIDAQLLTSRKLAVEQPELMVKTPAAVDPVAPATARAFKRLRASTFSSAEVSDFAAFKAKPQTAAVAAAPLLGAAAATRVSPAVAGVRLSRMPRGLETARSAAGRFGTVFVPPPSPPPPPPPPPPAPPPAMQLDESISVLAFICKRLPKAPDPLADLVWS